MSPSVSKDAILDAAEAIVCESGAAHMTLDGVAERANVSKGGLMYNFPSKTALLQAMVGRLIEKIESTREEIRATSSDKSQSELAVEIRTLSKLECEGAHPTAGLLAAIANEPEVLEPFRDEMKRRLESRILAVDDPKRSVILFLAAFGLHLSGLLNLPLFDTQQRKCTYEELLRLAENGEIPL